MLAPFGTPADAPSAQTLTVAPTPFPAVRVTAPPPTVRRASWYVRGKVVFDAVLATLLLAAASPVLLLVAVLVKLSSRGPVLYSQLRQGQDGRLFTIYKIRTMRPGGRSGGACWSRPDDPRVTAVGRLLRATHIDELPQLWNILRGDMSLVGPRPEFVEFAPALERAIPSFRDRLQVRPGLTGLAQVQLPPATDMDSVRLKVAHDLYYVRHLSCWLDLRILACTALHLSGLPCHALCRALLKTGREPLPDRG